MPTLLPAPENSIPQGDHILVVDDEPELAESVANLLKENGYQVEITHSAEEAWESLCKRLPILIITDDVMPGMDCWELLRCIYSSPLLEGIPVIRLGELPRRRSDFWPGYRYPAFAMWFTKPFNPAELLSVVRRILQWSNDSARYPI